MAQHEKLDLFRPGGSGRPPAGAGPVRGARRASLNARLPSYETIKKFALSPGSFPIDGGELTPTLKLKRKVIYEKYRDRIEKLYLDAQKGGNGMDQIQNGGNQ